jgi:hypothetical protein
MGAPGMQRLIIKNRTLILGAMLVILAGLLIRALFLEPEIIGPHLFRQAHVASNIHLYHENGISIESSMYTKNNTQMMFDFPIYQYIVTIISYATGPNRIVLVAKIVNILIYLLTTVTGIIILKKLKISDLVILLTTAIYSTARLTVFYQRAVLPDNLAVLLGLVSMACYLYWIESTNKPAIKAYVGLLLAAVTTTLIKSPVYLPFFFSIILHAALKFRLAIFKKPGMLVYGALVAGTVVFYQLLFNQINYGALFPESASSQLNWYFGGAGIRLYPSNYIKIFRQIFFSATNPIVFLFMLTGVVFVIKNKTMIQKNIFLFLGFASLMSMFIFFNLTVIHSYYLLPHIFIMSFFAAYGIESSLEYLSRGIQIKYLTIIVITIFTIFGIAYYYRFPLQFNIPFDYYRNGQRIQETTPENAFVFYVTLKKTWNPLQLYLARRHGYNIWIKDLDYDFIIDKVEEYSDRFDEFYLYGTERLTINSKFVKARVKLYQNGGKIIVKEHNHLLIKIPDIEKQTQ